MRGQRVFGTIGTTILVVQLVINVAVPLMAHAESPVTDHVVINEISAASGDKWVELYNPTSQSVDLNNWRVLYTSTDGKTTDAKVAANTTIESHKYYTFEAKSSLADAGGTLALYDADYDSADPTIGVVDAAISYPTMTKDQSYARSYDGADTWVLAGAPSKNTANPFDLTTAPTPSNAATSTTASMDIAWTPVDGAAQYRYRYAKDAVTSSDPVTTTRETSATLSGLTDGTYHWQVQALPAAGKASEWSALGSFVIDTMKPVVSINVPSPTVTGSTITVTANDAPSVSYNLELLRDDKSVVSASTTSSLVVPAVVNGNYSLHVIVADATGNVTTDDKSIVISNPKPIGTVRLGSSDASAVAGATITLSGTSVNTTKVTIKDTFTGVSKFATLNADGSWSYTVGDLIARNYSFEVTFSDENGNSTTETIGRTIAPFVAPTDATISNDLASQLSKPSVFIPLTTIVPVPVNNVERNTSASIAAIAPDLSIDSAGKKSTTLTDTSGQVLAATTSGWQVFGIGWQWWAIAIAMALGGWWWVHRQAHAAPRHMPAKPVSTRGERPLLQ